MSYSATAGEMGAERQVKHQLACPLAAAAADIAILSSIGCISALNLSWLAKLACVIFKNAGLQQLIKHARCLPL